MKVDEVKKFWVKLLCWLGGHEMEKQDFPRLLLLTDNPYLEYADELPDVPGTIYKCERCGKRELRDRETGAVIV